MSPSRSRSRSTIAGNSPRDGAPKGLDRHEALHAVGSALATHIWELAQAGAARPVSPDAYAAAVDRLTVESWRREFGKGDQ